MDQVLRMGLATLTLMAGVVFVADTGLLVNAAVGKAVSAAVDVDMHITESIGMSAPLGAVPGPANIAITETIGVTGIAGSSPAPVSIAISEAVGVGEPSASLMATMPPAPQAVPSATLPGLAVLAGGFLVILIVVRRKQLGKRT